MPASIGAISLVGRRRVRLKSVRRQDLAAVNTVRHSREWRIIYLRKKAQRQTAKQALVVVAVKLLHAVYAMLKHRQPYSSASSSRLR